MSIKKEQIVYIPRKGELYLGTEIECLLRGISVDIELGRIASVYGTSNSVIYGKHDGTIENNKEDWMPPTVGVELVTQPMTIDCYHNRSWRTIFERMVIPKNYTTCTLGGHVHVSKEFFSVTQLYKFIKFMRTNLEYIQYIGGRNIEGNNYCKTKLSTGNSVFQIKYNVANSDRYETVNLTNFGTVELRFFASPRTAIELYKNIEWCHALAHYTKQAPLYFTVQGFHNWMFNENDKSKLYKNICDFINPAMKFKQNAEIVISTPDKPRDMNAEHHTCTYCEDIMYEDWLYDESSLAYTCEDCTFRCCGCGDIYETDYANFISRNPDRHNIVCDRCLTTNVSTCTNCGDVHLTHEFQINEVLNTRLCWACVAPSAEETIYEGCTCEACQPTGWGASTAPLAESAIVEEPTISWHTVDYASLETMMLANPSIASSRTRTRSPRQ